ncbi:MAG: adaptor protein MecA [Eubacteriales bacterium]
MELTLIGKEKLEILLTEKDMNDFNITNDKLDYKNTETRRAVWTILDEAKHETGFDAANGKIRIDALPSRSGGCIIFITKTEHPFLTEADMNCSKENFPAVPEKTRMMIYGFPVMRELLRACRFLYCRGYDGESLVFMEKAESRAKSKYYLAITERIPSRSGASFSVFENMFISEFGVKMSDENAFSYINEHCDCICEKNAVKILSDMI